MDATENTMEDPFAALTSADPFSSWWPFIVAIVVGIITTVRTYYGGTHCPSQATIKGKTVVITGGSNGIGLQVVLELLRRGGKIIVGCRNPSAAEKVIRENAKSIKIEPGKLILKKLNLASLKSVREFVEGLGDHPKVDILINNAGIAFHDFQKSEDGLEIHLVTNYLSHFLLTHLLLPKLKAAENGRIINVSAQAHYAGDLFLDDLNMESSYSYNKAFAQSKLALVMMARHMSKVLKGTNVTINALHPGLVRNTNQFAKSPLCSSYMIRISISPWVWLFLKSPQQGAQTIIYLAVAPEVQTTSGKYFSECKITDPSEKALDESAADKLYQKSLQLVGLNSLE